MPEVLSAKSPTVTPGVPKAPGDKKRPLLITVSFWALAVFALVNAILWVVAGEEKATSKDLWGGTGSIDLALTDLKNLPARPNVVLLGSSLVMYPFWAIDKESNQNISDIFHHHRSYTMEKGLADAGVKQPIVFNLAIFGQMASDAYIYVNEYLTGDKKPDYLVLGIAPRDFSDYDLPSPTHTFTFKRLVGLKNFPLYQNLYLPGWQDKVDFLINHTCFFYGKRWRLQKELDKVIDKAYLAAGLTAPQKTEKKAQAGFMLDGSEEDRWSNSKEEYKRRYRNIGDRDLSVQMGFLNKLLATCEERGIKVIVVNMPLSDINQSLLPAGFYKQFSDQISALTSQHNAKFVDIGASTEFNHGDFWDTCHLNHSGGHKLVKHIQPLLLNSR